MTLFDSSTLGRLLVRLLLALDGDTGFKFDPRRKPWIVLKECPGSKEMWIQTRDRDVPLVQEHWEVPSGDAVVIDPAALAQRVETNELLAPARANPGIGARG